VLSDELLRTAVKRAELEADQFRISSAEFKNALSNISIFIRACSVLITELRYNRGKTK